MEPRYTNDESLPKLVSDLANLKREGSYWDFKREWHGNKADLLHDIICMANNPEDTTGLLIIGIDEKRTIDQRAMPSSWANGGIRKASLICCAQRVGLPEARKSVSSQSNCLTLALT